MTAPDQPKQRFDFVDESIMVRTMEGRINSWNRSAAELYGWRTEEAIGRISHELLQTRFPKPLEEIETELVRKGRWEGKLVHTTRDGGRVMVASRWALDIEGKSEVVVESTRPLMIAAMMETHRLRSRILCKACQHVLGGGALLLTLVRFLFDLLLPWTTQRQFTKPISELIYYFTRSVWPVSYLRF